MKINIIILLVFECLFCQICNTDNGKNNTRKNNTIGQNIRGARGQNIRGPGGQHNKGQRRQKNKPTGGQNTKKPNEADQRLTLSTIDNNMYEIFEVLQECLTPPEIPNTIKLLLEIGSGPGKHIMYIAPQIDFVDFQPTEYNMEWFPIIEMHRCFAGVLNILPVQYLNVNDHYTQWGNSSVKRKSFDYVLNINMIHVTAWPSIVGLFVGSSHVLKVEGLLFTYGPYANNGTITPRNVADFDARLRRTNRAWGLRDITEELIPLGRMTGFELIKTYDLPANDKMLVWQKIEKLQI